MGAHGYTGTGGLRPDVACNPAGSHGHSWVPEKYSRGTRYPAEVPATGPSCVKSVGVPMISHGTPHTGARGSSYWRGHSRALTSTYEHVRSAGPRQSSTNPSKAQAKLLEGARACFRGARGGARVISGVLAGNRAGARGRSQTITEALSRTPEPALAESRAGARCGLVRHINR